MCLLRTTDEFPVAARGMASGPAHCPTNDIDDTNQIASGGDGMCGETEATKGSKWKQQFQVT